MAPTPGRRRPLSPVMMVPCPRLINISCLEDLWSEEAAEVPLLASPCGRSSPIRWPKLLEMKETCNDFEDDGKGQQERELDSVPSVRLDEAGAVQEHINGVVGKKTQWQNNEDDGKESQERELDSVPSVPLDKAGAVQEHINGVVGKKRERQKNEVRAHIHAAIGRAAARAGDQAREQQQQREEALRANMAADPRAAGDASRETSSGGGAGDSSTGSSASSSSSSTWPANAADSAASTSGEEDHVNDFVQAQIRRATEAARKRRQAEADAMRNAGQEIQRAAREAWRRREAACREADVVGGALGVGWGGGGPALGGSDGSWKGEGACPGADSDAGGRWPPQLAAPTEHQRPPASQIWMAAPTPVEVCSANSAVQWSVPVNAAGHGPQAGHHSYLGLPPAPPVHAAPGFLPSPSPPRAAPPGRSAAAGLPPGWPNSAPYTPAGCGGVNCIVNSAAAGRAAGPWGHLGYPSAICGDASDRELPRPVPPKDGPLVKVCSRAH